GRPAGRGRRVPHRRGLPRRRYHRRVPLPAGRCVRGPGRGHRRGRHPRRGRGLRGAELAGRVRAVPRLQEGRHPVLLRHPQRFQIDDAERRNRADRGAGYRLLRREDPGPRGQCTKVDEKAPAEVAGLLGCGVMAGIGAAVNTGAIQRGESVAVIGLGGVGVAAIAGAKLAGATTIIGLDIDEQKLAAASELGATHTAVTKDLSPQQVAEKVQELTGGFGADVVIDAVGIPQTYEAAFYARDLAGRVVLVGVPHPDAKLTLPLLDVFGRGGSLKSSWYGDCLPERDFPYLTDLFLQGRLPLDRFVTGRT